MITNIFDKISLICKGMAIVIPFRKFITMPVLLMFLAGCSPGGISTTDTPSNILGSDEAMMLNDSADRTLIIAHRGARSLAPENTLAAARKALELGADLWELDVAVTADNELVVVHDDTLERTSNVKDLFPGRSPWQVWGFTLAEIKTLDSGSWFIRTDPFGQIKSGAVSQDEKESFVGEPMPTLREALEFTRDNHWRVNVELKDQPTEALGQVIVEKAVALIHELGMDDGVQVVVSSFNHDYLKNLRSLNSNIPIQALTSKKIKNLSDYLSVLGTNACNPKVDVWDPDELADLGQDGLQFNVWTVNDEATMRQLVDARVHGIFTDFPQVLSQVLNSSK